jgi:DNA-binding IclR family transcriptional regulator
MFPFAMSHKVIVTTWRGLSRRGRDLLVMMAIAEAVNDYGSGCISLEEIGFRAGVHRSTVKRSLKRLKDSGWLLGSRQSQVGQRACYQIALERLEG